MADFAIDFEWPRWSSYELQLGPFPSTWAGDLNRGYGRIIGKGTRRMSRPTPEAIDTVIGTLLTLATENKGALEHDGSPVESEKAWLDGIAASHARLA